MGTRKITPSLIHAGIGLSKVLKIDTKSKGFLINKSGGWEPVDSKIIPSLIKNLANALEKIQKLFVN